MSAADVRAALRQLEAARTALAESTKKIIDARAVWETTPTFLALVEEVAQRRHAAAEADGHARAVLVRHYDETKDKHPCQGGDVSLVTEYHFPYETALEWARTNARALVCEVLDRSAFDKLLAALPVLPPFVTKREVPQATVARLLNPAALAEPATPTEET